MKRFMVLSLALWAAFCVQAQDIAVRAGTLHTGAGSSIENALVVVREGRIAAVGPAYEVSVPDGIEIVEASVVTPGLIDARSTVGFSGAMNQPHDQDQLERSSAIQPDLRAIDAYNPRERLVEWLREHGITTVHTGHGPGEIISGQTLIAKTFGDTVDEAVIIPAYALSATLGDGATRHSRQSPGNRSKAVAMLREQLIKAREYQQKLNRMQDDKPEPDRDLSLEPLVALLEGEMPLIIEVNRHNDIMTALRLAEEFEFRLILAGAADAHLLIDEIRAAGVGVMIHPSMIRSRGAGSETANFSFTTAVKLLKAGIRVAMQSGYEGYVPKIRVVLFEAGLLLAYGASFDQALELVTIAPARMLGIDDRVGSIEVGKDGDLALFDGDPFEYTSHVIGTIIEGRQVSNVRR